MHKWWNVTLLWFCPALFLFGRLIRRSRWAQWRKPTVAMATRVWSSRTGCRLWRRCTTPTPWHQVPQVHTHTHTLTGNEPSALKSTAAHKLAFAFLSHTHSHMITLKYKYYHHNLSSFHFYLVHKALRLLYFHARLLSKHLIIINIIVFPPQAPIIPRCSCGSVGRDSEAWSRSSASLWWAGQIHTALIDGLLSVCYWITSFCVCGESSILIWRGWIMNQFIIPLFFNCTVATHDVSYSNLQYNEC